MSSSRDETSSRQKRVNSKRHFTIDRNNFVPGRVSSPDEISCVNTLLEISQNSQENTCARVSFLIKLQAEVYNFIKKEALTQVFSCIFCEISKKTFFTEHLWATASGSITSNTGTDRLANASTNAN